MQASNSRRRMSAYIIANPVQDTVSIQLREKLTLQLGLIQ